VSEDHVDRVRRQSSLPRTGEDPIEVVGRIFRYCVFLEQRVGAAFALAGLTRTEADLMAALFRSREKLVQPSRLAADLICSTGTMTNRLDRLEREGLIRRHDDPNDRRGVLIELTAKGRKTITAAVAARDEVGAELVPGLTVAERRQLTGLLRKALVVIEGHQATARVTKQKPRQRKSPSRK
jgi:DNA-binding MarR family transcriptional regulator